ncbi:hypothetical protein EV424DRAFT_1560447 [Suillus variegatus]|nr:hypothetical protein EV424DRAFT_1560447 [Suillus variegatus]
MGGNISLQCSFLLCIYLNRISHISTSSSRFGQQVEPDHWSSPRFEDDADLQNWFRTGLNLFEPLVLQRMSSMCAVGADGNLKDVSEIVWHNDPDDECPLPAPGPTTEQSTAPVHHFFTGARRSARAPRPSTKIVDPDNVASSSSARSKRKAVDSGPGTSWRVARKVIPASSASSDDAGNLDSEDDAECTDDGAEASYVQTKAMGDAV